MVAAFLDFEKAFDKIWHDGLIHKFIQSKIPNSLTKIIRSFLANKSYYVRKNGMKSTERTISAGVPQGSCQSPLLRNLLIKNIGQTLHPPDVVRPRPFALHKCNN